MSASGSSSYEPKPGLSGRAGPGTSSLVFVIPAMTASIVWCVPWSLAGNVLAVSRGDGKTTHESGGEIPEVRIGVGVSVVANKG